MKLIMLIASVFLLFSCTETGNPDLEAITADTRQLDIVFHGTDDSSCVTQGITLIEAGTNGSLISWSSSNEEIVSNNGIVTRPQFGEGNITVNLTAFLSNGIESERKDFELIVMEEPQEVTYGGIVAGDKDTLEIQFTGPNTASSITQDIILPELGAGGSIITWASNDPGIMSVEGTVTRPIYGTGSVTVVLTATITKGIVSDTKTFSLTVIEASQTDAQAVAEDKDALEIQFNGTDTISSVTENITLEELGASGSGITWESNDTDVISDDGNVTRPIYGTGSVTVVLTATITRGNDSDTRTFSLTVIEAPQTDAQAVAEDKEALEIQFNGTDNSSSVTENISLEELGASGSGITWESDDTDTISDDGTVTRPVYGTGDAVVVLTATIARGSVLDTKTFSLTVIEAPQTDAQAVAEDKAALEIQFNGPDTSSSVLDDITLQNSGSNGTTITWTTGLSGVITNTGTVTRPEPEIGNVDVDLTATISRNSAVDTKVFTVTVIALAAYTISFDDNDSTGGTVPESVTKVEGRDAEIPGNTESLTKDGWVFTGWNDLPDGSGETYLEGEAYQVDSDTTLYALWAGVNWAQMIPGGMGSSLNQIAVDNDGNTYITATLEGGGDYTFGPGVSAPDDQTQKYGALIKYNSDGTAQWIRTVESTVSSYKSYFNDVAVDSAGNVYCCGSLYTGGVFDFGNGVTAQGSILTNFNPVIVKYDPQGNAQWAKTVQGINSGTSVFNSIAVSGEYIYAAGSLDGNTDPYFFDTGISVTGGSTLSSGVVVKYTLSDGSVDWVKSTSSDSNGSTIFYETASDSGGNIYAGGKIPNAEISFGNSVAVSGSSSGNFLLIKYNASGEAQWARTPSGTDASSVSGLDVDGSDNVYASGYISGNNEFDFGDGSTVSGTHSSGANAVLVKYSSSGSTEWARTSAAGSDSSNFMHALAAGTDVYVFGYQSGTSLFSYGDGIDAAGTSTGVNAIIVKYDGNGNALWVKNPACGNKTRFSSGVINPVTDELYTIGYQYAQYSADYGIDRNGDLVTLTGTSMTYNMTVISYIH